MRILGLNPEGYSYHTEHLAPLLVLLEAPLVTANEEAASLARHYYPHLQVELKEWDFFTPETIGKEADLILTSEQWPKGQFYQTFSSYNPQLRHLHCPHGYSDKIFWLREVAFEDASLIYGPHMLKMLEKEGVLSELKNYIVTGNLRLQYYKKHQLFFDALYTKEIASQLPPAEKTLLYAPTWHDQEEASSFFHGLEPLIKALPKNWNLIVKLHPNLEREHPGEVYAAEERYKNEPRLLFLPDYPLVYPLLAHVDAYIGDASSVGYDFLAFDRPLLFLDTVGRSLPLHAAGRTWTPGEDLKKALEQETFSSKRKALYNDVFGPPQEEKALIEKIHALISPD